MINCRHRECILAVVAAVDQLGSPARIHLAVVHMLLAESTLLAVAACMLPAGHSLVAVLHTQAAVLHTQAAVLHTQAAVLHTLAAAVHTLAVEGSFEHTAVAVEEAAHSHGCMIDSHTVQGLWVDHVDLLSWHPEERI